MARNSSNRYHPVVRVLLLGGTAEARDLAAALAATDIAFTSSLAGRVSHPRLPVGEVRIGGFGGAEGLIAYMRAQQVTHLVDATHPFARTMSEHAAQACEVTGISLIRLERPGWTARPDADAWHWAQDLDDVRTQAESIGRRPFITSGRQTLYAFASWTDRNVLVRIVEPLNTATPPGWTVIEDRGPYSQTSERALMHAHAIDVLITKDSGGPHTAAKLDAAAELHIPVVVLARPASAQSATVVTDVAGCLNALR